MSDYWGEEPTKKHVNILVQCPSEDKSAVERPAKRQRLEREGEDENSIYFFSLRPSMTLVFQLKNHVTFDVQRLCPRAQFTPPLTTYHIRNRSV